jgi:hypothetical protein
LPHNSDYAALYGSNAVSVPKSNTTEPITITKSPAAGPQETGLPVASAAIFLTILNSGFVRSGLEVI